jgi:phosphoglycolate phosphatase
MFENVVYPGIADLLTQLSAEDFALWVATSKPTTFARSILEHFKLAAYFYAIYGSELDGTRSDKRALLAHLLNAEDISAVDSVMIGDREHDVAAARENHLPAIGVTWGYGSPNELLGAGAASVVTDPVHLSEVLRAWRSGSAPA